MGAVVLVGVKNILNSLTTEDAQNTVPGIIRYACIWGVILATIIAIILAVKGSLTFLEFCGGFGTLLGAISAAMWGEAQASAVPGPKE